MSLKNNKRLIKPNIHIFLIREVYNIMKAYSFNSFLIFIYFKKFIKIIQNFMNKILEKVIKLINKNKYLLGINLD